MKSVELSILIVNYKSKLYLQRCLKSLERLPKDMSRETIVVENGSHDGSLAMLRWDYPEVIYIINERNRGFARAMNQAFKIVRGRFILWLNPDTEYMEGDLEEALKYFEE